MAGVTAQVELLLNRSPEELRPKLQLVLEAMRRLAGVIEALLTMARSGRAPRMREFRASALVTAALARRIAVDSSQLQEIGVCGDPDLLAVAVANLVDNAVRHGASHVALRAGREGSAQWIEVIDDGPGIPAERLATLRTALATFESSGMVDETLGLGLTLAAMVARAHGGAIELGESHDSPRFAVRLKW